MRPFAHWIVPGLLLLAVLVPGPAVAERLADDRFALLGPHDGLDGRVLDVAQDPLGFLWFATTTGLQRYDGSRLVSFRHDPDDPHSISDDHVRKLLVDSAGSLWIATDGGLDRWLPAEERFRRLAQGLGGIPASLGEIAPGQLLVALQGADVVRVSTTDETVERIGDLDSVDCLVVDSVRGSVWGLGPHGLARHTSDSAWIYSHGPGREVSAPPRGASGPLPKTRSGASGSVAEAMASPAWIAGPVRWSATRRNPTACPTTPPGRCTTKHRGICG